jgi:hypothetical protein
VPFHPALSDLFPVLISVFTAGGFPAALSVPVSSNTVSRRLRFGSYRIEHR